MIGDTNYTAFIVSVDLKQTLSLLKMNIPTSQIQLPLFYWINVLSSSLNNVHR